MSATETPDPPPPKPAVEEAPPPVELALSRKSYRRKYRKIMVDFEHKMRESNALFKDEQRIFDISQRIAEQTDQLLQLLVDLNSCPQVPRRVRYDVRSKQSSTNAEPEPMNVYDEEKGHLRLRKARYQLQTGEMTPMDYQDLKDEILRSQDFAPEKSYASLTQAVPHPPSPVTESKDSGSQSMVPYLSSQQEEQYKQSLDAFLNGETDHSRGHVARPLAMANGEKTTEREREMQLRNPVSVYNWLRKNKPNVFLQDNESSADKPARATGSRSSKRNANRDSIVKQENDMYDEDGIAVDAPSTRGKRKRDDDSGYRPKGGNSRPTKRKKEETGTHSRRSSKKLSIDVR